MSENYTLFVTIQVKPEKREQFLELTIPYGQECRNEPGNIDFKMYVDEEDQNKFIVYESFQSKAAFQAHRTYPHALKWKKEVENLMEKPRERVRGYPVE